VVGVPLCVFAGLIVPQVGEQAVPFCVSDQETPPLLASLVTVAVNCCMVLTRTLGEEGATVTAIVGAMVTVAVADLVVSATDVAITVTDAGDGALAGAINVVAAPLAVDFGETLPHCCAVQLTVQLTP